MRATVRVLGGLTLACLAAAPAHAVPIVPPTFTTIAYIGEAVPQVPGRTYDSFDEPLTNNSGTATIYGEYSMEFGRSGEGIWTGPIGNLQLLATTGAAAPGTSAGVVFGSSTLGFAAMGEFTDAPIGGVVAFASSLTGAGVTATNDFGIWSGTPGQIQLVARTGSVAPGGAATYSSLSQQFSVNTSGVVAFNGTLIGTGITNGINDKGLWVGAPGSLQLVAQTGTQAPGLPTGTNFAPLNFLGFNLISLNDSGTVAFAGGLTGPQVGGYPNSGIWIGKPGSLQLVADANETAPGTNGATFGAFGTSHDSQREPVLSSNGDLAFRADLFNGGTTTSNNFGLFAWTQNSLKLVARAGDPAPGVPNATFASAGNGFSYFSQPSLDGGHIAFQAGLIGPAINQNNNAGIWEGTISSFNLVAREGQQAPGTAAGVLFNTATGASTCFTDPLVSALGETVFTSTLTGPGVTNLNNEGLWATDPNGDLSLIMRLGDQINLGALGIKTITAIGYVNDTTAWGSNTDGLNDLGQISVQLQFNDATEALVLVQLPVPEPATWLLVGLGGICIWFSPAVSKAADLRRKRSRSQRTMIA